MIYSTANSENKKLERTTKTMSQPPIGLKSSSHFPDFRMLSILNERATSSELERMSIEWWIDILILQAPESAMQMRRKISGDGYERS